MSLIQKFLLYTFGIKPPHDPIKPCGINRSIVPRSFLKDYPVWDSDKFKNQIYID